MLIEPLPEGTAISLTKPVEVWLRNPKTKQVDETTLLPGVKGHISEVRLRWKLGHEVVGYTYIVDFDGIEGARSAFSPDDRPFEVC